MFLRLCGPPSIPLSFTVEVEYLMLSLKSLNLYRPNNQYSSFTAWTTRVSNPVRYPRFRASASVECSEAAFAIGVLRDIYAFHRYTTHSASVAPTQARQFQRRHRVEPGDLTADLARRLRTL